VEFCELRTNGVLRSSAVAKACKCRSPSEGSGSGLGRSKAGGSSVLRGCLEVAQQPALVLPLGLLLLLTAGGLLGLLGDPTHGVLRTLGSLARLLGYLAGGLLGLLERLVYVLCQPEVLSRLI
jgi:hypothetical protein